MPGDGCRAFACCESMAPAQEDAPTRLRATDSGSTCGVVAASDASFYLLWPMHALTPRGLVVAIAGHPGFLINGKRVQRWPIIRMTPLRDFLKIATYEGSDVRDASTFAEVAIGDYTPIDNRRSEFVGYAHLSVVLEQDVAQGLCDWAHFRSPQDCRVPCFPAVGKACSLPHSGRPAVPRDFGAPGPCPQCNESACLRK